MKFKQQNFVRKFKKRELAERGKIDSKLSQLNNYSLSAIKPVK